MSTMKIEHRHTFSPEEARERVRALGEYLQRRHGIGVTWESNDRASVKGKYMVVSIEGHVTFGNGIVYFEGKDPGFLWRGKAKDYLNKKLAQYLDSKTPIGQLPRS